MPCRAPVRCITTLSVLERLQHMKQLHLQVFRPVFFKKKVMWYINIYIYLYIYIYIKTDYSARKQRMALWESAAEGLWISSQLKVMFKGPEALGWFGGQLQYHAILRWKKVYNLRRYFSSDNKNCETIFVEHKAWRFVDRKKKQMWGQLNQDRVQTLLRLLFDQGILAIKLSVSFFSWFLVRLEKRRFHQGDTALHDPKTALSLIAWDLSCNTEDV